MQNRQILLKPLKEISQHLADLSKFCLDNENLIVLYYSVEMGLQHLLDQMNVTEMNVLYAVVQGVPLCLIEEVTIQTSL